jgi:Bacterial Ig-like domain
MKRLIAIPGPAWPRTVLGVSLLLPALIAGCGGSGISQPVLGAAASILGWTPGVTRDVPLSAPLTVFFSRGMNRSSVERSWHLTPAVRGAFSWARTSVSFRPRSPLSAGQYYRLSVGRKARDDQGKRAAIRPPP